MPPWLTLILLPLSAVLWCLGTSNRDDVIGLLEHMIAVGCLMVVVLGARPLPLELAGVGLALWLPRARGRSDLPPPPHRDDVLIPFV